MAETKTFDYNNDLLGLKLLENFLPKTQYLPYTSSSLSFEAIRFIANDIVVNQRRHVLEFGAGVSTLVLGALLKGLDVPGQILSLEEDERWCEIMTGIAGREGLDTVTIVHCPLADESAEHYPQWYQAEHAKKAILTPVDLVIADGPSAWQENRKSSRRSAVPFLADHDLLRKESYAVYLDDCNRKAETKILEDWSDQLGVPSRMITSSLGRISKGDFFNII